MIFGVSARQYTRTVEELSNSYGISKSTISRKVINARAEKLKDLMERRLDYLDIMVLAIDAVHIGSTAQIVAIGVDSEEKKHVIGFRQGATENTAVTLELFKDLASRGMDTSHSVLVLIDGSKALQSAVKKFADDQALIHCCQINKLCNVCEHRLLKYQGHFARKMKAAYAMKTYVDAKEALVKIVVELDRINESAANSLREGLEKHRPFTGSRCRMSFGKVFQIRTSSNRRSMSVVT